MSNKTLITRGWLSGDGVTLAVRGWVSNDVVTEEVRAGAKDYGQPVVQSDDEFIMAFVAISTETLIRCLH